MKKVFALLSIALLAFPMLAMANVVSPPADPLNIAKVVNILKTFVNWFFTILIILAVVFIFVAAFYYLTAAGDAEKVKTAHQTLIYAIVAIAVALLAVGIRYLVAELVGVQPPTV